MGFPRKMAILCAPFVLVGMLGCQPALRDLGGESGTPYDPPKRTTEGQYDSPIWGPSAVPGAEARGNLAAALEDSKPRFSGWVNGIYLYPPPDDAPNDFVPDPSAVQPECATEMRLMSEQELSTTRYHLDVPAGMPSGAIETEGPFAQACGDSVTVVSRQFELQPYGVLVGLLLWPNAKGAPFSASEDRIQALTISERRAVLVKALTDEGFGNSAVFMLTDRGLVQVGAYDLVPADLLAIADSML